METKKLICGRCQEDWEEDTSGNCVNCNCMTAEEIKEEKKESIE